MLRAPTSKRGGTLAPAWGVGGNEELDNNNTDNAATALGHPSSQKALIDFEAEDRDLERARCADIQVDGSHIKQLRTLVAGFVRNSRTLGTVSPGLVPAAQGAKRTFPEWKAAEAVPKALPTGTHKENTSVEKAEKSTNYHRPLRTINQGSGMVAMGSRASFVAELLVQVSRLGRR